MNRTRKLIVVTILAILFVPRSSPALAVSGSPLFVYLSRGKVDSQFRWRRLGSTTEQIIDIPGGVQQTVLGGNYVAFSRRDYDVTILNLNDGQQTNLGVALEEEELLFDDLYIVVNRSLMWSPDNRYLAFTGHTFDKHSDVYIYDTQTQALTNLTENLPSNYSDADSWSTDGQWLAFNAGMNNLNEPFNEPFIASLDGKIITRLTPGQGACRLIWSPDDKHLVSTTDCLVGLGDDNNLVILDFDPQHPEQPSSTRQIVSAKYGHLVSRQYFAPVWYNNTTIMTVRVLSPNAINLSWSDIKTNLVFYDLTKQHETLARIMPAAMQPSPNAGFLSGWLFWIPEHSDARYAYNVEHKQLVDLTGLYQCVNNYHLTDDGKYAAIPSGCNLNDLHTLRVVSLPSRREVLNIKAKPDEYLDPVGFVDQP